MTWRSQGDSNPCFRRERAAVSVRHGSCWYAILFDMSSLIPMGMSSLFAVDRHDTPPSTGHKLDTDRLWRAPSERLVWKQERRA